MYTFKARLLCVFILSCLLAAFPGSHARAQSTIIYVDQDAIHGLNNGTSWKNAYLSLQFALADAVSGDAIFVAEGTYKPTTGSDRTATFQLKGGVDLAGGFVGTEQYPSQRDLTAHVTILSGDIGRPDVSTDNSYHVVTGSTSSTASMDGFTITGGNADGGPLNDVGGGLFRLSPGGDTLELTRVIFRDNSAIAHGGGIYANNVDLTLTKATFEDNTAGSYGGGMYIEDGTTTISGGTFKGNSAHMGGGLYAYDNGTVTITNSTFYDNHATHGPGGGIYNNSTAMTVSYSTFSHNRVASYGAGIHNFDGVLTLSNSILANSAPSADCYHASGTLSTDHNLIENNAFEPNACDLPFITSDPNLGPLQNNSGITQTMALLPGSPAIDAANDTTCPDTDQRRVRRPQSSHCDIGAYEVQTAPAKAVLVTPSGSGSSTPFFLWREANATWYYLWVDGPSGNVVKQWYSAEQAGCGEVGCSVAPLGLTLSSGTYTWWVQTWNETGYGPWSDPMTFEVPAPPLPGKATLVSPSGSITMTRPSYTWNEVSDATWYYLWVDGPSGNVLKQWYEASVICSAGLCSVKPDIALGAGAHRWWVQTWNEAGYGLWSDGMNFNVSAPGKATLVSPHEDIATITPIYTWIEVPSATWYYLWVDGPSGNVLKQWYEASVICSAGSCSVKPDIALGAGAHRWWVQTWNEAGYGLWSDGMNFTVPSSLPPGKTTLSAPTGSITTNTPTYTWDEVNGATWYYLWVDGPTRNVIANWYTSDQANCNETTCWVTPTTTLGSGTYRWWVQTYNSSGYGPWSDAMNFTVP